MHLISFEKNGTRSFGAIKDGGVVDLGRHMADQNIGTLRALLTADAIEAAADILRSASIDTSLESISFLPVIPDPPKIFCVGLNYRDHVAETGQTETAHPAYLLAFQAARSAIYSQ